MPFVSIYQWNLQMKQDFVPTEEQISRWMWVEHGIREIIKHGVNYVIVSRKIWSANLKFKKGSGRIDITAAGSSQHGGSGTVNTTYTTGAWIGNLTKSIGVSRNSTHRIAAWSRCRYYSIPCKECRKWRPSHTASSDADDSIFMRGWCKASIEIMIAFVSFNC